MNTANLSKIYDANHLIRSFYETKKGTDWKESVQRYEVNLMREIYHTQQDIQNGSYDMLPCVEFILRERGHVRDIKSFHISDRTVLRAMCDYVLMPAVRKYLIHDNGASIKGKGIDFSRRRFEEHIHKFYRHHGRDGYILFIDFSKFFDNIPHELATNQYKGLLTDDEIEFFAKLLKPFEVDVSYLSDGEFADYIDRVFSSLDYQSVDKSLLTGEKFMRKSVGIGSQISQITGIFYPHEIDNYCKIVRGMKYYGRYMDDTYIICESKEELQDILRNIDVICNRLKIHINSKKTRICKLDTEFVYLKTIYYLTETGKLIKRISRETLQRERRKLKKYKKLVDSKKMTYEDAFSCYKSWRGTFAKYDSGYQIKKMDNYFSDLFTEYVTKEAQ